ncbi:hypothetical protein BDV19DRAFT_43005 [Aspergillus venezuelensis]
MCPTITHQWISSMIFFLVNETALTVANIIDTIAPTVHLFVIGRFAVHRTLDYEVRRGYRGLELEVLVHDGRYGQTQDDTIQHVETVLSTSPISRNRFEQRQSGLFAKDNEVRITFYTVNDMAPQEPFTNYASYLRRDRSPVSSPCSQCSYSCRSRGQHLPGVARSSSIGIRNHAIRL